MVVAGACAVLLAALPAKASDVLGSPVIFKSYGQDRLVKIRAWLPDGAPVKGILYLPPCWGGDTR
jgi:hypothetical protein